MKRPGLSRVVVATDRRARELFEDPDLDLAVTPRREGVEVASEPFEGLARQSDDQVQVEVRVGPFAQKAQVLPDLFQVQRPADVFGDGGVEGLDADLQLQPCRAEAGDAAAQRFGKMVRDHFEMQKGLFVLRQEIVEDLRGVGELQVEGTVDELEVPHAPLPERFESFEHGAEVEIAHPFVDGGEAEFAEEGTAA